MIGAEVPKDLAAAGVTAEPVEYEREELRRALAEADRALVEGAPVPSVRARIRDRLVELAQQERASDAAEVIRSYMLLSELAERPELLAPPEEIVPRIAWRGRGTILVAGPKDGKSTLASAVAAALSCGSWWLGERVARGRVIVVAPDEYVGDTVRRLVEMGTDGSRVRILVTRPRDALAELKAVLEEWPADLVVIDSLIEWARVVLGTSPEDGDSSAWGQVTRPLVDIARDHNCALLALHHARRSDGEIRGSGEIAAAFDAVLTMRPGRPDEDPTLRRVTGRARWAVEPYTVRMEDGRYVLGGGGPVSLDARVVTDVATHPGTSRAASYDRLGGRKASHVAAVGRLLEAQTLVDRGGNLYLADDVEGELL